MVTDRRIIELSPETVRDILGEPYDGSENHDAFLTAALVADGAPTWVGTATVERIGERLRLSAKQTAQKAS
jgi:hypothetical protein